MARAAGSSPDEWYARLVHLKKRVERIRYIPALAFTRNDRNRGLLTAQGNQYMAMLGKVMRAAASVAGVSTIIDSSKYPPHGFFLANCKEIDLYPVHLVRDSRAVAFSQQRTKIRPEIYWTTEFMPRLSPAQTAFDWMLNNSCMQLLGRVTGRYLQVRYEDIVMAPEQASKTLLDWVGLDSSQLADSAAGPNVGTEHQVSGNPMRFQSAFEITPDMQWLDRMTTRDKVVTTVITAPLLVRYGYKL
jgi:hypothetical protein